MCYPCSRCGRCNKPRKIPIKCPKCKVELTKENPVCAKCGWSLPSAPGVVSETATTAEKQS